MRVGISLTSNYPDVTDPRQGARWMIERAASARRAGLDSLFVGDQHASPTPYYQPSERQPVTGPEFLHALILGIEIQLRVDNILVTPPAKCPVGVSMQSILGVIGAAVASAKLLRLSEQQMVWAIGLATAQAAGHRETHSTMSSHFVPANAARAGLVASLLAAQDYTTGEAAIEGPKGFAGIFAS